MNKIDINKKYRTREGGYPARIICADAKGRQPIVALITDSAGEERAMMYNEDGTWHYDGRVCESDLIEVPELEFDWSCLPAWAEWITWGGGFGWIWWQNKPMLGAVSVWLDPIIGSFGIIPSDFLPRYNGSDPAPIFKRPSKEGGEA